MILRHGRWWDCEAAADEAALAARDAADVEREPMRGPPTVAATLAADARAHADAVAVEAAATAALVAQYERDAESLTRWCEPCGLPVWPTYPRDRWCVRCGAPWARERAA